MLIHTLRFEQKNRGSCPSVFCNQVVYITPFIYLTFKPFDVFQVTPECNHLLASLSLWGIRLAYSLPLFLFFLHIYLSAKRSSSPRAAIAPIIIIASILSVFILIAIRVRCNSNDYRVQ